VEGIVLMVDVLDGDHDRLMMKLWLRKKFGFQGWPKGKAGQARVLGPPNLFIFIKELGPQKNYSLNFIYRVRPHFIHSKLFSSIGRALAMRKGRTLVQTHGVLFSIIYLFFSLILVFLRWNE
jgi:hypothetical protein